jgi:hypothetical protein
MIDYKNPDYIPILKKRIELLQKLQVEPKTLEAFKLHYKDNPIDFINDWGMTYDPRKQPAAMPFLLFPKQEEFILFLKSCYDNKEDGLAEKSRDMGFTWLGVAFSVWLWLFHDGVKVGWGSRKQDLVDRMGDPDSIFEKMRMFIRLLPNVFLPIGYNEIKHANFLKIIAPVNGSVIAGEAGDNIGRGGRSSIYFKDESAFYERPEKIEAALSQNTDVKIDISTPNGNGNPFYVKRFSGKVKVFTMNWRDDPRKDDEWYKKQCDTLDTVTVAQEIDIDYSASVENVCIPALWVSAAINYPLPQEGMKFAGYDVADEGSDYYALVKRHGNFVYHTEKWKTGTTTQSTRKVYNDCLEDSVDIINYDSVGVGAGAKGEFAELNPDIKMSISGINTGDGVGIGMYRDTGREKKAMFLNLKAYLWWDMRLRFKRTYEVKNGLAEYPPEELISIPNDSELISELSQPKYLFAENGKIQIESKKDMKKRGIPSPNKADALMLSFSPQTGDSLAILDYMKQLSTAKTNS